MSRFARVASACVVLAATALPGVGQTPRLNSIVVAEAGVFNPPPFNSTSSYTIGSASRSDAAGLTFDRTYSYTGQSSAGVPATMGYAVTGFAQSGYGVLRASFNTAVTNAFYDPANPAFNPSTGGGVPHTLGGQTNAGFQDRLMITDPAVTEIRLSVRMTGSLSQAGSAYPFAAGYAALWQNYPSGGNSIIPGARADTAAGGTFDQLITTEP